MRKFKEYALPIFFIGLSWPFFGMGFMAIYFGYLPSGLAFVAECLGLFVAGAMSGVLLVSALESMDTTYGRRLIALGYFLFAPVGLLAALVSPTSLEPAGGESWLVFMLAAPVIIALVASVAVAFGLGLTQGLAVAATKFVNKDA